MVVIITGGFAAGVLAAAITLSVPHLWRMVKDGVGEGVQTGILFGALAAFLPGRNKRADLIPPVSSVPEFPVRSPICGWDVFLSRSYFFP